MSAAAGAAPRDEALRVLAALYQRRGGAATSLLDLGNDLSLTLAWFTPTEAKLVLRAAERDGLLRPAEGGYVPGFDPAGLTLPVGYRPPKTLVAWARRKLDAEEAAPEPADPADGAAAAPAPEARPADDSLLERFVRRIAEHAAEPTPLVRDRVLVQQRALGGASAETAAMLVALSLGADVADLIVAYEAHLRA